MNAKCDVCSRVIRITPTVNRAAERDGLIMLCKSCWSKKGMSRDRYSGQIQNGYYLAN